MAFIPWSKREGVIDCLTEMVSDLVEAEPWRQGPWNVIIARAYDDCINTCCVAFSAVLEHEDGDDELEVDGFFHIEDPEHPEALARLAAEIAERCFEQIANVAGY